MFHYSMQVTSIGIQGTRTRRPSGAIDATEDAVGGVPLPSLAKMFLQQ